MNVAIIPARGGSKGIKKKNIVDFLGKPLIEHTINQARDSSCLDGIYVSTDSEDIAEISKEAGAKIIDRPEEIAGDEATTESALLHALEHIREEENMDPDIMTLLQCTSPLRRRNDIDETAKLVSEGGYDSALSVCEDHSFYWEKGRNGFESINYSPQTRKRRQDLEKRYQENGSIYVFKTEILEEKECRLGGKIGAHQMPETHSFEIDTPDDLEITRAVGQNVVFHTG
ncbi:cytidylyltransferase domain-containing protein [Candidatus Nanohalococcus occultus]|uniref:CMP-N-acetylneuraminic acid synthetase n=1 Tax=Candidatus Nanohalococcus occultus TaxID=2978047 RepID=A0ABY8CJA2_9ARCH|nr:CMP-N-acetylneuraminic acid synthetase [Candidatus Nanohaloarchaeota archaeon SVXNc]